MLDLVPHLFQKSRMPESPALAMAAETAERRAAAVARGICRLFARNDIWALAEMPLRNGRRADLMGIDAPSHPLAAARRKVEIERLARTALRRQLVGVDPHCSAWGQGHG